MTCISREHRQRQALFQCMCRGQERPSPPSEAQLQRVARSELATGYLWRTRMMRGTASAAAPQRHSGLGVEAYAQVTSPIRR
jgi:exoribonuclease R